MNTAIPTVNLTVRIYDQDGDPVKDALIVASLSTPERYKGFIIPEEFRGTTDEDGRCVIKVFPNELGTEGSEYRIIMKPKHGRSITVFATVPNVDCNLEEISNLEPYPVRGAGDIITAKVMASADSARQAANESRDNADYVRANLNTAIEGAVRAETAQDQAETHAAIATTKAELSTVKASLSGASAITAGAYSELAHAWAESEASPDPDNHPGSASAKSWAEDARKTTQQLPVVATATTSPRTLAARFADVINVKDFGAKGDGITDDTTAFRAAATSGLSVFVPPGGYVVTQEGERIAGALYDRGGVTFPNDNVISSGNEVIGVYDDDYRHFNYFPASLLPPDKALVLYITKDGTDTISGVNHGRTIATAFASFQAALRHAHQYYKQTGMGRVYTFAFGLGEWGDIELYGTGLLQGRIAITSIWFDASRSWFPTAKPSNMTDAEYAAMDWPADPTAEYPYAYNQWAKFNNINVLGQHISLDVRGVWARSISNTYNNYVRASDIRVRGSVVGQSSAFSAFQGGHLYLVNTISFDETSTYSAAPFYASFAGAFISLENGDGTDINDLRNTTLTRLLNRQNITAPNKFYASIGSVAWASTNIYPQMDYASKYLVDASSWCRTLDKSSVPHYEESQLVVGGPCIQQFGNSLRGIRWYQNGYAEEWINISLNNIPVGESPAIFSIIPRSYFKELPQVIISGNSNSTMVTQNISNSTERGIAVSTNNTTQSKSSIYLVCRMYGQLNKSVVTDDPVSGVLQGTTIDLAAEAPVALDFKRYTTGYVLVYFSMNVTVANPAGFTVNINGTPIVPTGASLKSGFVNEVTLTLGRTVTTSDVITVSGAAGVVTSVAGGVGSKAFSNVLVP